MTTSADALFVADDDRWIATEWSRGPWDPRHCHGGPVAALLARAVEHAEDGSSADGADAATTHDERWQIARTTLELTRPVPVGRPLRLETHLERPGRRVGLVAATLTDDGTEVARVRALRIRRDPTAVSGDDRDTIDALGLTGVAAGGAGPDHLPAGPDESRPERPSLTGSSDEISFARHACEHRFAAGSWVEPGPVDVWIRLTLPVVTGEEPTPLQRTVAAADFGNGVSSVLPWDRYLFINPDLTVHLARAAVGEWIGLRSVTRVGDAGAGLAESSLHDVEGTIGRSLQSLFVAPRT